MSPRQQFVWARLLIVAAAVLWSGNSFFTRVLTSETVLHLDQPHLSPMQIAIWRALFAGLALVPIVRRAEARYHPLMPAMIACFSLMCGLYLSALALGNAANAILLQNTSPAWVYLFGVYLIGQRTDRSTGQATLLGLIGAVIIVVGNSLDGPSAEAAGEVTVLLMGLGSGITYGGVVLFLNHLRAYSAAWLMVLNLLGSVVCLSVAMVLLHGVDEFFGGLFKASLSQLLFIALFGIVQMAMPYWLFARGLRTISATEAGIITLLEPILNPIWAYLITEGRERPSIWTWLGGVLLFAALAWRYLPRARKQPPATEPR